MNPHSLSKKRELGAYYTPSELSKVLADWAIHSIEEDVLEPSFGGCGFFESSINRFNELGSHNPKDRIYGVDIDKHAFDILGAKYKTLVNLNSRFILQDFLQVKPSDFSVDGFDVVIGNHPYVSMHNMTEKQRESCEKILLNSPFAHETMGRNASLWAFFLLHSLDFLKDEGRVAWVLPCSLLHANYAEKLLSFYQAHFQKIKIVKLAERFFRDEGAKETSVILLAEGFKRVPRRKKGNLYINTADNVEQLIESIERLEDGTSTNIRDYKLDLIPPPAKLAYQTLQRKSCIVSLGDLADIKIGMVTGANNVFIVDKKTVDYYQLPDEVLKPVVARFNSLQGLMHNKCRHKESVKNNSRAYLVCPTVEQMQDVNSAVYRYLSQITEQARKENRTFKKRPHWFSPGWGIDGLKADCFLSYMIHRGPRLVINANKQFNCTNSIHKVIFRERVSAAKKSAIAITMFSSLTQLSAEIEGRAYSSGVLKIEPSAGRQLKLLISDECIDTLVALKEQVELELKLGNHRAITDIVDNALIGQGLISQEQSENFRMAIIALRKERYKGSQKYYD